ncbi:hypothetical protein DFH09DRAFT_1491692 [Mycena vulgaris]|nr:hypothetical protein DFH09DRAFT_1491692 [Mycena vulgaris]
MIRLDLAAQRGLEAVAIPLVLMFLAARAAPLPRRPRPYSLRQQGCSREGPIIRDRSGATHYSYVSSADNLADASSRGLDAPHIRAHDRLSRRFAMPAELAEMFSPTSLRPLDEFSLSAALPTSFASSSRPVRPR